MKIRRVEAELFHADGRTGRRIEDPTNEWTDNRAADMRKLMLSAILLTRLKLMQQWQVSNFLFDNLQREISEIVHKNSVYT
jgi:hypothetical protein